MVRVGLLFDRLNAVTAPLPYSVGAAVPSELRAAERDRRVRLLWRPVLARRLARPSFSS